MNLSTESWIPVLHKSGEHRLINLRQVFSEGKEYTDVAVRTHERIALMRLLICIAQAALDGPKNLGEWEKAPKNLPLAAEKYFQQQENSFDLFSFKKPFLQISELEQASDIETLFSKLEFTLATNTGQNLFDHGFLTNRIYEPNEIALILISYLNFSTGGGLPIAQWGNIKTKNVGNTDAPCIPTSMFHTLLRGKNILETLQMNLITKETVSYRLGIPWGKPVWEYMPETPQDEAAIANAKETYLGRLTPLSRWIKLKKGSNKILCCNGFDYVSQNIRETTSTIIIKTKNGKQERAPLGATSGRSVWRDLPALITKRIADNESLGGAITLQNAPLDKAYDIYVGALIRKSGQQDIEDMVESVLHIPLSLNTNYGIAAYDSEVAFAEFIAKKLSSAVEIYRINLDKDWSKRLKGKAGWAIRNKLHESATRHYWTAVEKLLPLLLTYVEAIGGDSDTVVKNKDTWRSEVHAAARDAYCLACGQETSRQMRAFALGRERLFAQRTEDEPSDELETETNEQE
jgi:CRISPR system Cascade subunit CasA